MCVCLVRAGEGGGGALLLGACVNQCSVEVKGPANPNNLRTHAHSARGGMLPCSLPCSSVPMYSFSACWRLLLPACHLTRACCGGWGWCCWRVRTAVQSTASVAKIYDRQPLPAPWGLGRVTLLGDAAHPVLPTLGQVWSSASARCGECPACLNKLFRRGVFDPLACGRKMLCLQAVVAPCV